MAEKNERKLMEESDDPAILLKVEDLIRMSIMVEPQEKNLAAVNFKMIQTVLYILARHMRLLNQHVDMRVDDQTTSDPDKEVQKQKDKEKKLTGKAADSEGVKESRKSAKAKKLPEDADARKVPEDAEAEELAKDAEKDVSGKVAGKEQISQVKQEKKQDTTQTTELKDGGTMHDKPEKKEKKSKKKGEQDSDPNQNLTEGETKEKSGKAEKPKDGETGTGGTGGKGVQRVGSIEVVTMKQFAALEEAVKELERKAGPLPPPVMPDNKKLVADINKGRASLTDTMEAMKLSSRVDAAEKAIGRMTELLTALAGTGTLPAEVASKAKDIQGGFESIKQDLQKSGKSATAKSTADKSTSDKSTADKSTADKSTADKSTADKSTAAKTKADTVSLSSKKSVYIDPFSKTETKSTISVSSGPGFSLGDQSALTSPATTIGPSLTQNDNQAVTQLELDNALYQLRNELLTALPTMTARATSTADNAMHMVKTIVDKLEIASKLNSRVSNLYSLITDYSTQLKGFDAGLKQQIQGFAEQMMQMQKDLNEGIQQLENVNNNAETAAVLELKERFQIVLQEFDIALHKHGQLSDFQRVLKDELKSFVDCLEMMKEQKADREEIMDGLRDKADLSCLEGLLTEECFKFARGELETRLQLCYNTFLQQDAVWMEVIHDFHETIADKAELMMLLGTRDDAQNSLSIVHDSVRKLELLIGDPKTAILIRELSKDGTCAICRVPAIMDIETQSKGAPPSLPESHPKPVFPIDDPHIDRAMECAKAWLPQPKPIDDKVHLCHRYVGGSHTLLDHRYIKRGPVQSGLEAGEPMHQFTGTGTDGKRYKMEEGQVPCVECNVPENYGTRMMGDSPPPTIYTDGQLSRLSVPALPQHRATRLDILRPTDALTRSHSRVGSVGNIIKGRTRSSVMNAEAMRQAVLEQDKLDDRVASQSQTVGAPISNSAVQDKEPENTDVSNLEQPPTEHVEAVEVIEKEEVLEQSLQPQEESPGQNEQIQAEAQAPSAE